MSIQKKYCLLSIDVEEDLNSSPATFNCIENIDPLIELYEAFGAKLTLFVTGNILNNYPEKIRYWYKNGHEIAMHGWEHTPLQKLLFEEREEHIKKFLDKYKKVLNSEPNGFRAVQLKIDKLQLNLLKKYNFKYDSSVLPRYIPFRKSGAFKGKAPIQPYHPEENNYIKEDLKEKFWEMPISTAIIGIPLYGTWLRYLGANFLYLLSKTNSKYLTFACHPWDAVKYQGSLSMRSGKDFLKSLEFLLKSLQKNNFSFINHNKYINLK